MLFDPDSGETRAMRSKEDAADYRYFPDPDLPPLVIAPEWIEQLRAAMPELPRVRAAVQRIQPEVRAHHAWRDERKLDPGVGLLHLDPKTRRQ